MKKKTKKMSETELDNVSSGVFDVIGVDTDGSCVELDPKTGIQIQRVCSSCEYYVIDNGKKVCTRKK